MKEEKFPHTRKPLHWRRGMVAGDALAPCRRGQQQGCRGQSGEIPAQRIMPTSTHQPKRLVCSPAGADVDCGLRLGLQSSDPRERTRVG